MNLTTLFCVSLALTAGALAHPLKPALDGERFIQLLGATYQQPAIQALQQRFAAQPPIMDYEDATAHWYFYDSAGVDFTFADEAIFTDDEAEDIGTGNLYFTGIDFYARSADRAFQRQHILPFGLRYGDNYARAVTKMTQAGALPHQQISGGESQWAVKRADGQRYAVTLTVDKTSGVTALKIRLYHGQDYLSWMRPAESPTSQK